MTHYIAIGNRGSDLSGRSLGRELRHQIIDAVNQGKPVVLNFFGVESASDSFLDELFAVLVASHGKAWFRENVRVEEIKDSITRDILGTVQRRLEVGQRRLVDALSTTPPPSC